MEGGKTKMEGGKFERLEYNYESFFRFYGHQREFRTPNSPSNSGFREFARIRDRNFRPPAEMASLASTTANAAFDPSTLRSRAPRRLVLRCRSLGRTRHTSHVLYALTGRRSLPSMAPCSDLLSVLYVVQGPQ